MRTLLGIVVAVAVGAILAVTAAFTLVTTNAPDEAAEEQLRKGAATEKSVLEYGQR